LPSTLKAEFEFDISLLMNTSYEPARALEDTVFLFDSLSIPYFLVGSFASGFRGEFRATNDIDIVCAFTPGNLSGFIERAKSCFYADEIAIQNRYESRKSFNLIHEETFVKIDCFTQITPFEEEQFSLASRLKIPFTDDCRVSVSTAEYNIIAKINWYIKSNYVLDRQIADVKSMIAINKSDLDLDYLKKWSAYFGSTARLNDLGLEL
jgi:hypothetical protein